MADNLPARIDRAAIERIIQRATELQTGEREIGDGMSPDEVVTLGKEVGIPERYLRQAILEEHGAAELPLGNGFLDRAVGQETIGAQRVVTGRQEEIQQRLRDYLEREELLTLQRELTGRITWEPVGGFESALRRSAAAIGGRKAFMLGKANLVTATVTPLEDGYCHVQLTAKLGTARNGIIAGVAALGVVGAMATAVLALLSPFWWVAATPLPVVAGLGFVVAGQYRPMAQRALLGLERALDHLERGQVKPSHALPPKAAGLLGAVLDEVRRAMQ
jgi:hypothetical protein